jgi:hypothetical protein
MTSNRHPETGDSDTTRSSTELVTLSPGSPMKPPAWLATWTADMPVPVTVDQISAELARCETAMTPAGPKAAGVLIGQCLILHGTPPNFELQQPIYLRTVSALPGDLVALAMRRLERAKWFPKPGDILDTVADELAERRRAILRLRQALWHRRNQRDPVPIERGDIAPVTQAALDAMRRPRHDTGSMRKLDEVARPVAALPRHELPPVDDPEVQRWLRDMGA